MAEPVKPAAINPFQGRTPTSHERQSGEAWDASYTKGPAPWDIGPPQPAIVRLAARGVFAGSVLDVGCGLGENARHIASLGLSVLGVDVAETALAIARQNARKLGIPAEFAKADAFHLEQLGRTFDTVLDCGLFHTLESDEASVYAIGLASVTKPAGSLYVLCFSDEGPDVGPHPVQRSDLKAAFSPQNGWNITTITTERIETRYHAHSVSAWLATVQRVSRQTTDSLDPQS